MAVHVLHLNINGLRTKRSEVDLYLGETKPDIVCFNETRCRGDTAPRLSGYQRVCQRDRIGPFPNGGGVAIYARKGLQCSDVSPDADDIVAVKLLGTYDLVVAAYYCPDWATFDVPMLEELIHKYDRLVIMGDLNAKHQYYGSRSTDIRGEYLFDLVERNNLFVANNPTQVTRHDVQTGSQDIIDYAIVSEAVVGKLVDCFVGDDVPSDHLPLHLKLRLGTGLNSVQTRKVRRIAKCDWSVFTDTILTDADDAFSGNTPVGEADIDAKCEAIEKSIVQAFEKACPLRTEKDYAFRVKPDTLKLIREKRKLRRKCQKDCRYKTAYNVLSRRVKEAIYAERMAAWNSATGSLNDTDGRKFWQQFKRLTGAGKGGGTGRPPKLREATGELTDDPERVANEFASTLERVHRTHDGPEFCDGTRETVERHVENHRDLFTPLFPVRPEPDDDSPLADDVTLEELRSALRRCKTRSSPGPDGIGYAILKKLPEPALEALAVLYTKCLAHGYFPRRWKSAKGVMLPKPGKDGTLASSYRPISLLCTLGKLLERVIAKRLSTHLTEANFFNDWQRAYQSKKEASEILYRLGEEVRCARAKDWVTTAVSLDVEKAFDAVWHDGLRYKLHGLGLPARVLRLLSSFLTDRQVQVRVGSTLSRGVRLEAGTPQGSVLSPLLFLIYVNDLPIQPQGHCRGGQFADDVNTWTTSRTCGFARTRLQSQLTEIERWCSKWRIKLNVAKTQLMTFSGSPSFRTLDLKLFDQRLVMCNEMKVLGVTFNRNMSLVPHCRAVATKAIRRVNLLRMVSGQGWGANARTLLRLYRQYVRPVLEYGQVVTAEGCASALQLLCRVEYKAMRVCTRSAPWTPIEDLYEMTGLEPLPERLGRLRSKAIDRFGSSDSMERLKTLKAIMGVDDGQTAG